MIFSKDTGEILIALSKVQSKIYGEGLFFVKSADNPFFKSKYLPLPQLLGQIVPHLLEQNCILTQHPIPAMKDGHICVQSRITHVLSGQWAASYAEVPMVGNDPQKYGSAITYARRYSLEPLLGIPTKDDDGEIAVGRTPKPKRKQTKAPTVMRPSATVAIVTSTQAADIKAKATEKGLTAVQSKYIANRFGNGAKSWSQVPKENVGQIIFAIEHNLTHDDAVAGGK